MTLATKITISRIALIPVMIAVYFWGFEGSAIVTTAIFALAAYTDHLDGYIARKTNTVTNMGKFLDPIADKLLVVIAMLMLMQNNAGGIYVPGPWLMVATIILIVREFVIAALRQIAATNGKVIAADKLGKIKTVLQDISVPMMFMTPVLVPVMPWFVYISYAMLAASTVVAMISGVNYVVKNRSVLTEV